VTEPCESQVSVFYVGYPAAVVRRLPFRCNRLLLKETALVGECPQDAREPRVRQRPLSYFVSKLTEAGDAELAREEEEEESTEPGA
jgi:hypothetical protein